VLPSILTEPYDLPYQQGESPRGHDPNTSPDGGDITGSTWNADWRGQDFSPNQYQGFGGRDGTLMGGQPTTWSSYTGLVESDPEIHGYGGGQWLQEQSMHDLRAGSTIEFPTHGQAGEGFDAAMFEIPFDSGNDVGWQQWNDATRRMLFLEPPTYSEQTDPISAAGWP